MKKYKYKLTPHDFTRKIYEKESFTFRQLSSKCCELLWVFQELHHILQLVFGLFYTFDVFKVDILEKDRVNGRIQA